MGQEDPNLKLKEPAASPRGEMFRFLHFYVSVYKNPTNSPFLGKVTVSALAREVWKCSGLQKQKRGDD